MLAAAILVAAASTLVGIWLVSAAATGGGGATRQEITLSVVAGVGFGSFFIFLSLVERGRIAGDLLLRRLAKLLVSVGLDVYYSQADEFLCRGGSREELTAKLSQASKLFKESFQIYAEGRIRTIEGTDVSFGIGATTGEQQAALQQARNAKAGNESPEWLREIIATAGHGQDW